MKPSKNNNEFLILDCHSRPVAHGVLLNPSDHSNWHIQVLRGQIATVEPLHELQLVNMSDHHCSYLVHITSSHGEIIDVEFLRPLGEEFRETLRVPVAFSSYIYPLSGSWKGRRPIQAIDLSCGGIAFFCHEALSKGESLEVVLPIAHQPLILTCEVLRSRPSSTGDTIYALKFIDLCDEADKLVQEFVFNEQIRNQLP